METGRRGRVLKKEQTKSFFYFFSVWEKTFVIMFLFEKV